MVVVLEEELAEVLVLVAALEVELVEVAEPEEALVEVLEEELVVAVVPAVVEELAVDFKFLDPYPYDIMFLCKMRYTSIVAICKYVQQMN